MARADSSSRPAGATGRKKLFIRGFVIVYLVVQLTLPILGLLADDSDPDGVPFSWQMFSRLPDADHED